MSQRLKDLRLSIQTIEQADAEFATFAKAKIECARIDADAEAAIARIKGTADCEKEYHQAVIDKAERELAAYIESHPDEFSKPRKRKTDWGTYGLHTATKVNVFDKDAAILHCEINGFADCLKTSITLLTAKVKERLDAGEQIDGCELQSGDIALCTVKKELLDEVKKGEK